MTEQGQAFGKQSEGIGEAHHLQMRNVFNHAHNAQAPMGENAKATFPVYNLGFSPF